ncbi:MAG: hypothetical protein NC306_12605 [Butyrivibrio sp.]|nr:hypothetical protein [Butyrivibrio sp.]
MKHTKKRIADAMVSCLQTMSLDSITVKKVCEVADINRSTFYTYYSSPCELYAMIEKNFIEGLNIYLSELKSNPLSYPDFLKYMVTYTERNEKTYLALVKTNSASLKQTNTAHIEELGLWNLPQYNRYRNYAEEYIISVY